LNAVTYAIWWHKPLGVQEPIKVYSKMEVVEKKGPARQVGCFSFFPSKTLNVVQEDGHLISLQPFSESLAVN
jgi:hypothetical protein